MTCDPVAVYYTVFGFDYLALQEGYLEATYCFGKSNVLESNERLATIFRGNTVLKGCSRRCH